VGGPSLTLDTPARRRLADDLLGWGAQRPEVDDGLVAELRSELEDGVRRLGDDLANVAAEQRRGHVLVTKTRLDRVVCDGLQLDPRPFEHTRASVRGILAHAVIERDWDLGRQVDPVEVVGEVWHDQASRRPGDPRSLSAWMNAQPPDEVAELRDELADLAVGFREVWPELPPTLVQRQAERPYDVPVADGLVRLFGRPDLVLDSPRNDGRARALVVDLKTGRPRSDHDRHELRFYALLVTLATGLPPFRWATYYVTEGRFEAEDLRAETLHLTVKRVVDTVGQLVRLAAFGDEVPQEAQRLRGGSWCFMCLREDTCEVAGQARAERAMSHPDAML
jgi:hypothetical protein